MIVLTGHEITGHETGEDESFYWHRPGTASAQSDTSSSPGAPPCTPAPGSAPPCSRSSSTVYQPNLPPPRVFPRAISYREQKYLQEFRTSLCCASCIQLFCFLKSHFHIDYFWNAIVRITQLKIYFITKWKLKDKHGTKCNWRNDAVSTSLGVQIFLIEGLRSEK